MNYLLKLYTILMFKFLIIGSFFSQSIESKLILKEGNESYKKGDFANSSSSYNNSLELDQDNLDALYNNGNSSIMSGEFELARENFKKYISNSKNDEDKSKAHYNIGNSFLNQYEKEAKDGKQPSSEYLKNAVNEYKQSIRYNPKDSDARYNLSYALKMMQKQQNKDQEKKDQENKDQEKKDQEKKDQEKKDQEKKDQEKKDQEKKDQEKKDQEKKEQKENKAKETKQQAIKNLDAINGDEEKVLLKVNRKKGDQNKKSKTKDW